MSDPKPFASLSSGLLARKGAARPAMKPQGFGQMGGGNLEDLGWNDMGFEPPKPADPPVRDADHDAFGEEIDDEPRQHPTGLTPIHSPVHSQQAELAERLAAEQGEDEEFDETAEIFDPEDQTFASLAPGSAPEPEEAEETADPEEPFELEQSFEAEETFEVQETFEPEQSPEAEETFDAQQRFEPEQPFEAEQPFELNQPLEAEQAFEPEQAEAEPEAEFRPLLATKPHAAAPAPVQPTTPLAVAPAPVQPTTPLAVAPAPVQPTTPLAVAPAPVQPATPRAVAPATKSKAAFTLRLDPDRHLKLRLACAVNGRSAQQIVTDAVDQLLAAFPELDAMAEKAKRKG